MTVGERKHSHQRLFKRKRDKQTVPAAGRKCKFPARWKDGEKNKGSNTAGVLSEPPAFPPVRRVTPPLNFMCQLYAIVFTLLPARFDVAGRRVFEVAPVSSARCVTRREIFAPGDREAKNRT